MDATHDPTKKSFIPVEEESHFPIQNLPYGSFKKPQSEKIRIGVAIGKFILDLSVIESKGLLNDTYPKEQHFFSQSSLNSFMGEGRNLWRKVRAEISSLLDENNPKLRDNEELRKKAILAMSNVQMQLPVRITDYTDFYSSREHATNVGTMFRGKNNALQPNWLHLPVGYHGRASSVVISGTDFPRPKGQTKTDDQITPIYGPSKLMDFELEMGFFVGPGNNLGHSVPINKAEEHIFGMTVVNDWSARDIQKWEYIPLGPFNSKNFITSISPWVVTLEALEPFATNGPIQDPKPLEYLKPNKQKTYDVHLEVLLQTSSMSKPERIITSNFKYLYWTMFQQLTHHSITGCNMQTGDLLASGTISGPAKSERGCMLELTWRGQNPIKLSSGEERKFLADYDKVILTGWCQGDGYRVGFGEVTGTLLPTL
ncbi:MAG: fumarylacetoacetase [Candidatus Hodarchaeales archaeon]|jgi:fumarylacetoacetase